MPELNPLGKLPKNSDSRTLWLPSLVTRKQPRQADVHHETAVTSPWGPLGNDHLMDCALAAAGHAEMVWAGLYADHRNTLPDSHPEPPKPPTETEIVDAYSQITGYKDGDPSTDNGADLLSVLKYWQSTGIAGQKIVAFAEIPPHDVETVKWTIESLGVAYVGFGLPRAYEASMVRGRPPGDFATKRTFHDPTTWQNAINGHCVLYTGYDSDDVFTCVSWGGLLKVTAAFHRAYCDEAYALIAPERVSAGVTKDGLDEGRMDTALHLAKSVALVDVAI